MRIGVHISVSRGLIHALEYAQEVGSECIQIFAKNPRRWFASPQDPVAAHEFSRATKRFGVRGVFTHTAYLINLASADATVRERSIAALADELDRGDLLRADGVITHLGSDPTSTREEACERIARAIEDVFARACAARDGQRPRLLLENSAGAGSGYGTDIAEIAAIFDAVSPSTRARLGVCVDTCHAHAAGVDVRTVDAWTALFDESERAIGPGSVVAIHANDSVFPFGSRKDRHAWVGEGTLGYEGFAALFAALPGRDIAVIAEAPGETPEKDVVNIERLKGLRVRSQAKTA